MATKRYTPEQIAAVEQHKMNRAKYPEMFPHPMRLRSPSSERKRARQILVARHAVRARPKALVWHHAAVAEINSIASVRREVARIRSVAKLHAEGTGNSRLFAPLRAHGSFDAWCSKLIESAKLRLKSANDFTKFSAGAMPS